MARKNPSRRSGDTRKRRPKRRGTEQAATPARERKPKASAAEPEPAAVQVVGVGASAGGLEAFSQLLSGLPEEPGVGLVLIQHLAPQHESALPVLLSGISKLPVVQAAEGMVVETNCVYVTPPNVQVSISAGTLHLTPRPTDRSQYTPIDFFLRSLANSERDRAVAVILSGTASDGAAGVRDVKAVGGTTFAQRPETAKYDGMPRSAIATGMVDLVLSPAAIAAELTHLARRAPFDALDSEQLIGSTPVPDGELARVFALLRAATSVDFRHYKRPTVMRRLQRRMDLQRISSLDLYIRHLEETPAEVLRLYQDILIQVTRFFREPESFEGLSALAFPEILRARQRDAPLRIWVCGCATGEEAYSVAIALLEFLGDQAGTVPIQIFATDVSESAIETARKGIFSEAIAADVSPERLRRFFTRVGGSYRVNQMVRDLCVFARQDLARDPPFSRLDLILCRNVLIYLNVALQQKLMGIFHYALKPSGYLALGQAETVGGQNTLFAISDKKQRLYVKKSQRERAPVHFPIDYAPTPPRENLGRARQDGPSIQHEANRVLLDRYAPPGVVVDAGLSIVQFRGQTGRYLEAASGDATLSLLKMAREGLLYGLRTGIAAAQKRNSAVRREGVRVRADGGWLTLDLEITPLQVGGRAHFLVAFDEPGGRPNRRPAKPAAGRGKRPDPGRSALEQELAENRQHLQSIIEELEAANEELQSANEEILSSNEELQSTNEELDTAKEELQSANEELTTVNEELHGRNDELSRVNSDLVNLLGSVEIAIVIVSSDMRIRRFTPMATRILNLIPSDVGRPIGHIKPNFDCPDLEALIVESVARVSMTERDVQDAQGTWYSLRIRPYKSVDNRIDGAVLTLFDVDASKRHEDGVRKARDFAQAIRDTVRSPLLLVDDALRVQSVNRAFTETFGVRAEEAEGRDLFQISAGGFDLAALRARIEPMLRSGERVEDLELDHDFPGVGRRRLVLNGRRIEAVGEDGNFTLLALEDRTGRKDG